MNASSRRILSCSLETFGAWGLSALLGCSSSSAPTQGGPDATTTDAREAGHGEAGDEAAADVDAGDFTNTGCPDGAPTDAPPPPTTVTLPSACALPPQECNPLGGAGCDLATGQTCDLAQTGAFACAATGDAPAGLGSACSGTAGPFCGTGLTCVAGQCAAYCCADTDCSGGNSCVPLRAMRASGGHVGTCVARDAGSGGSDGGDAAAGGSDGGGTLSSDAGDAAASEGGSGVGSLDAGVSPEFIGNHRAIYEGRGFLVPWTSWGDALGRAIHWYGTTCANVSGYPIFATSTFLDENCNNTGDQIIVAMQDGTGILSYLKYYVHGGRKDATLLATAKSMGDYIVHEALTPTGAGIAYPAFPRSTGAAEAVPQLPDCGTQDDMPFEVEPDKGGLAGFALMELAAETGDTTYSDAALTIAQTLAKNMLPGDERQSPWPFRVDYRTGEGRGPVSADLSFILRLFDALLPTHSELAAPRAALWSFIKNLQIPNAACDGHLWVQFFEDFESTFDRNAWSPLNLARYLIEQKAMVDPDWQADAATLLQFVNTAFVDVIDGFPVCIEQDFDRKPYGGILSTYGGVTAMYAAATGKSAERLHAYQVLTILLYSVNDDGCPADEAFNGGAGGWQEDAHFDRIHNYMDALDAFPDWEN